MLAQKSQTDLKSQTNFENDILPLCEYVVYMYRITSGHKVNINTELIKKGEFVNRSPWKVQVVYWFWQPEVTK